MTDEHTVSTQQKTVATDRDLQSSKLRNYSKKKNEDVSFPSISIKTDYLTLSQKLEEPMTFTKTHFLKRADPKLLLMATKAKEAELKASIEAERLHKLRTRSNLSTNDQQARPAAMTHIKFNKTVKARADDFSAHNAHFAQTEDIGRSHRQRAQEMESPDMSRFNS